MHDEEQLAVNGALCIHVESTQLTTQRPHRLQGDGTVRVNQRGCAEADCLLRQRLEHVHLRHS